MLELRVLYQYLTCAFTCCCTDHEPGLVAALDLDHYHVISVSIRSLVKDLSLCSISVRTFSGVQDCSVF